MKFFSSSMQSELLFLYGHVILLCIPDTRIWYHAKDEIRMQTPVDVKLPYVIYQSASI